MIELLHDVFQDCLRDVREIGMFGQLLANEAVHVLVGATLPGSIGMREVEIEIEFRGDRFVLCELLAVVGGHGVRDGSERSQLL